MDFERSRRFQAECDLSVAQTEKGILMQQAHYEAIKRLEAESDARSAESKNRRANRELAEANRTIEAQKLTINQFARKAKENEEVLADWIASQKAFKELAIQFGIEKGMVVEEIIEMGLDKQIDVLEGKNDPSHNTHMNTTPEIRQKLIDNYHKEKAERQAKKQ